MLKKFPYKLLAFLLVIQSVTTFATIPSGYYYFAKNKKKAELKTALRIYSTPLYELDYGSGPGFTWEGFYKTDNRTDTVIDMYSDSIRKFNGFTAVSGMHIEHSLPKSWWGAHENGAYKDLFHLYPADGLTNSTKNDLPLGEVTGTPTLNNGVTKIGKNGFGAYYTGNCFEPADEYKGDFARSYFYISTVYETLSALWQSPMMDNNTWPVWKPWAIDLLLKWHRQDPVSVKELARQENVYAIQGNRNPFIDFPNLAEYIWGADTTKVYPFPVETGAFLVTPRRGTKIDFGVILQTDTRKQKLHLEGANLNTSLPLKIENRQSAFVISLPNVPADSVMKGKDIEITFSPSSAGEYHDTLKISGAGITDTLLVPVKALASADFITLEPANITAVGGTLQWISDPQATDYQLTVYNGDQEAGDLIISAYIEGTSWNKALELYNGTNRTIDLSNYSLQKQSNGAGSFANTLKLSGTLAPKSTYVIVQKQAGAALMAKQNLVTDTILQFNGNDAIRLVRSGVTIDMVGRANAGADVIWGLDLGLQRKSPVTHPSTTFDAAEWKTLPIDSVAFLGAHQMTLLTSSPQFILQTNTGLTTSYDIQTLSPLSTSTYRVVAVKSGGNVAAINTMQIKTAPLDVPLALEATDVTSSGFTARWELSPFAQRYKLSMFQLTGSADTTVTEGFLGVGTTGKPLPTGWTGTASGNYDTSSSSGLAVPSVGLKTNGEWLQTKTYPQPVTYFTFMYRFPSAATGSSFLLDALSGSVWTRIDSIAYKGTTAKTYPPYTFDKSKNYTAFKFTYKKTAGNLAIDDVQARYGSQDTAFFVTPDNLTTDEYVFSGATPFTDYFYKVAAVRDNVTSAYSETIHVRTALGTGFTKTELLNPHIFVAENSVHISGIKSGDIVQLYSLTGNCIGSCRANGETAILRIPKKGICIVRVTGIETNFATKIIY